MIYFQVARQRLSAGTLPLAILLTLTIGCAKPPDPAPKPDTAAVKRVLILCTGNSCRSQMAEAFWNQLGQGRWQASSAGVKPAGYVHPLAIQVMSESGLDLRNNRSKHLEELRDRPFDLVVTVCDSAKEECPVLPNAKELLHWPFEDPAKAPGTDEEKLVVFRQVRDQIREKIASYLQHL